MNYLVAVFGDRIKAEAAYVALEKADLPREQIDILGRGYKDLTEVDLEDPNEKLRDRMRLMVTWLVPFGFAGGVAFSLATGLDTFSFAGEIGNHVVGGLMGAIGAAMGGLFINGGPILALGKGDSMAYRDRLAAEQYLVVVQGTDGVMRRAGSVLKRQNPDLLQDVGDGSLAID